MRRNISLVVMVVVWIWMAYGTLFEALPRLYEEWNHAAEFVPAKGARIVQAKCTNWNFGMFNHCVVGATTAVGQQVEVSDWRFGAAPTGRVMLMQRNTTPPTYTTSVSLTTITARAWFMAMSVTLSVGFFMTLILFAASPTARQRFRANLEQRRSRRA